MEEEKLCFCLLAFMVAGTFIDPVSATADSFAFFWVFNMY